MDIDKEKEEIMHRQSDLLESYCEVIQKHKGKMNPAEFTFGMLRYTVELAMKAAPTHEKAKQMITKSLEHIYKHPSDYIV